jgi:ATP-binding cassette subfamily B protein
VAAEAGEPLGHWIEAAARWLGLEAEPVETPYAEAEQLISRAGPALLRLPGGPEPRFLVILHGTVRRICVLTPKGGVVRLPVETVREALCQDLEAPVTHHVEQLLAAAGVPARRRPRSRQILLRRLIGSARLDACWMIRPAGAGGFVREARLGRLLLAVVGAQACEYTIWILSWWLLGWMCLGGHLDLGWLLAWMLLVVTLLPFRLFSTLAGGLLSIRAGTVLKRRLLGGALQLDPDDIRHLGVGQLLGRVVESEVIELMALTGAFLGITAAVELILAGVILVAGAASWIHVILLLGAGLAALLLGLRYYQRRRQWTEERLQMTNDMVERMVGHRTRLAQELRERWNEGEDQALERYLGISGEVDRGAVVLQAIVPRAWFIAAIIALAPAFVAAGTSTAALAIGVGGSILAYRALRNLTEGIERLAAAAIVWERNQLFWQAAARREPVGHPNFVAALPRPTDSRPLLDARDLVFRYRDRREAVLEGVGLRVCAGERVLLEGPSGGGKSTLAALLAAARRAESGVILLGGLDRETLGADNWRRRVVIAPQFHDNHVLMGTFAFNVLMGRGWPPRQADLDEAERVCRALALGPLLGRMPAGMLQMVGETGWQLSHGEKSRLYIARALLQGADLIMLDESFAALDPQTLGQTLAFLLEKAPTVLVIAHP